MSVYVDEAKHSYGRMIMCHMIADTPEELPAMAEKIGIARKWYQGPDKASFPHYDIAKSKRALAVQAGALEVDRRGLSALVKTIRKRILDCPAFAASWRA